MARQTEILLKNNKRIILRPLMRIDIDNIWDNFNQVIEEIDKGPYLPTFEKVTTDYEKRAWYQDIVENNNLCLVAEDPENSFRRNSHKVIAQCTIENVAWEASPHVAVLGIIVRKNYRNTGLGYQLMKYSLDKAKENGKKKIILSTFNTNENAIHLYEKLGFNKVGFRNKHFFMNGKYIDEVLMEIWLGDE
ncbi:MAG: GNAT family N-acetyltransferase [archaeon]|nr:GNAT family N-acetyltransferase [archaeon]